MYVIKGVKVGCILISLIFKIYINSITNYITYCRSLYLRVSLGTIKFLIRFHCASHNPSIDCIIDLSLQNPLKKYNGLFIGIGKEEGENNNRGLTRLNMLEILNSQGAISMSDKKVP